MNEYLQVGLAFGAAAVAMTIITALLTLGGFKGVKDNFKRIEGKDIFAGIAMVTVALAIIITIFTFGATKVNALEVDYFNYVEAEAGIVYTKSPSPQCEAGGIDDRATSDIRFTANTVSVMSSDRKMRFDANIEYLHHSGAFCVDDRSFDSLGPKMRLRWEF